MTEPVPAASDKWQPFRCPMQRESPPEPVVPRAIPQDGRVWGPLDEHFYFRRLCLSASCGHRMKLLRARRAGVLSRLRHPRPVHALVLKGRWRHLAHDCGATEGACVPETLGENHTAIVDPDGRCNSCDDISSRQTAAATM